MKSESISNMASTAIIAIISVLIVVAIAIPIFNGIW